MWKRVETLAAHKNWIKDPQTLWQSPTTRSTKTSVSHVSKPKDNIWQQVIFIQVSSIQYSRRNSAIMHGNFCIPKRPSQIYARTWKAIRRLWGTGYAQWYRPHHYKLVVSQKNIPNEHNHVITHMHITKRINRQRMRYQGAHPGNE